MVVLQAEDGTNFVFDPINLIFASDASTCAEDSP